MIPNYVKAITSDWSPRCTVVFGSQMSNAERHGADAGLDEMIICKRIERDRESGGHSCACDALHARPQLSARWKHGRLKRRGRTSSVGNLAGPVRSILDTHSTRLHLHRGKDV
jgi:hypothetical protein